MNFRAMMQSGPAKAIELFSKLADTSDGAVKTRERLFAELKAELELHTSLEEQHLFPILRKNPETKDLVADAIRENKELRAKLDELDALPKNDETFSGKLADLQKAFRQHARDEKKELLPAVQRALSDEQVQDVTERMEAGLAEAEQAKQDEAEERRARQRQDREQAEFMARQAELRVEQAQTAERERAAAEQRARADARRMADAAAMPAAVAAKAAGETARLATAASADARGRAQAQASALTNMFMWPWLGAMQNMPNPGKATPARGPSGMEEVIPLGEEVLEVGKRTENRGTARIHRFVVETPVERQVTLQSERVVVERRRPVSDTATGEILTEVTVEVVETEEVPTVSKRMRLREEVVVRMERTQRVETVRETVRRDEVEIEQAGRKRGNQHRAVAAEH
ncbi:hemerythrin domain-containing protein [Falsiroseomonas sp.]|uniref:hemerythrin domain-containing protein n=1 Tax=Falsiroseomonas sp. TaxID=2870721 RepID=UPI003565AC05